MFTYKTNRYIFLPVKQYFTTFSKTDLPIMPRVAFAHQTLKEAIKKHEKSLPESFTNQLLTSLAEIRKINWHYYNSEGLEFYEVQKVKKLLEVLHDYETIMPEILAKELENVAVFESLRGAIECLDERVKTNNSNTI